MREHQENQIRIQQQIIAQQREFEKKHMEEMMRIQQQQIAAQQGMQTQLQGQQNQGFNQQANFTQTSNEAFSMQWTPVDPNNPAHQAFIKK